MTTGTGILNLFGTQALVARYSKPIPRWDVHFEGLEDYRKDSTAPHITHRPQLGGHRQCGLAICTFHIGFSLGNKGQSYCTGSDMVLGT